MSGREVSAQMRGCGPNDQGLGHLDLTASLKDQSVVQVEMTRPYSSSPFIHETVSYLQQSRLET